jgi:hypothetical protein
MSSRREAAAMLLCAGAFAAGPLRASAKLADGGLPMPEGPVKLLRLLDRRFHDGSQLTVMREWTVHFAREGVGITLSGTQSSAEAWATPGSEDLARAQEERTVEEMWPIRLNARGMILVGPRTSLDDRGAQISGADQLPDDLFYPSLGPLRSHRNVTMSDGRVGEFSLEYDATSVAGKGWLHHARRRIATRIGSSVESATERWILSEL